MFLRRILRSISPVLLTVSLGFPVAVWAEDKTPADTAKVAAAEGFAHERSDLKPDERLRFGTLENGLRYVVMHNDTPEGVAALRMIVETGSLNETDEQRGIAHFLEHMAFNGSKNVPEGEMVKRLERLGLSFGADTNASTGYERTTYKLNLPSVSDDVLDEAFFLMRETAENLLLDAGAIERERGVIASEKRSRDTVDFRSLMARQDFLTAGSTRSERSPIGIDETIASMPKSEFEAYYRGYYRPENTVVVLIGDLDTDDAIQRIENAFGDWTPQGAALPDRALSPAELGPGRAGYYFDSSIESSLTLAALRPYAERPDSKAERRAAIIRAIGHAIVNRRFARTIERGNPAYIGGQTGRYRARNVADGAILTLRFDPEKWEAALADGDLELRRAIEFGFSETEMQDILASYLRGYQTQADQAGTRRTYAGRNAGLIDVVTGRLARDRVITSPQAELALFEEIAPTISVEEVNVAFRADWAGYDTASIFLSGGVALDNHETRLSAALADARRVDAEPMMARETAEFPYTDFGEPGRVVSHEYVEDLGAHLVTFDNNVRLTFKETEFEGENIRITVRVGDGFLSMPAGGEGLRRLGLNLLSRGGVEGFYEDDLRRIFAGKSVSSRFRTRIDEDAFSLEGSTNPSDLTDQLNLMTAKVTAPVFRDVTAKRHFDLMRAWYPRHDGTIGGVVSKELPRLVRSGNKRYGFDDIGDFLSPDIAEVQDWIAPQLARGPIEIVMVGDIAYETALAQIARTLGALPPRAASKGSYPEAQATTFPDGREEPYIYRHRDNPDQALVRVYWPAPDASDPADGFRMQVLRSLFRNRLSDVLREELGATYSPGVGIFSNALFDDYGYMLAHVITSPAEAETVRESILAVSAAMAAEPISEDDFQRALLPLIKDVGSSLESNAYWMGVLGDAQTSGHSVQEFRLREATYREMTVTDIETLAASVFDNTNSVAAFILPAATGE